MTFLVFVFGIMLGGAVAWWLASQHASSLLARNGAAMRREVRYWQEAAARANREVRRLAREAESWSAGCKQGREDVISIVPLLMAAQQRGGGGEAAADENR